MRQCKVYVHGIYAGVLKENGRKDYTFEYDKDYYEDAGLPPVCFAMPKSQMKYSSEFLFPFFSNMLTEGENRKMQASCLKIDEDDDFGLLLETATYDTPGAVTVKAI